MALTATEFIALVTAVASGLYTVWQGVATERQARELEALKSRFALEQQKAQAVLTDENAEEQARREYRFEALKRLYADVQPLMFQMRDPLQSAVDHVANFARASRDGRLSGPDRPWLTDVYYIDATLYRLTAPAAYYELMRERLSLIDLSLDARAAAAYRLLDQYTRAMRADYRLAPAFYGERGYQPDGPTRPEDGAGRRQGLLAGTRDVMVQSMLRDDPAAAGPGRRRVVRFGEFQNDRLAAPATFQPLVGILSGFRPERAPVLCAVLLLLAGLAELTRRALARDAPDILAEARGLAADEGFWTAYEFGFPAAADSARVRQAAMSDLLECAGRAAGAGD